MVATKRSKGQILKGSKGVHKGTKAIYLGNSKVRIVTGDLKGWVGEDKKLIFKPS